jgi:hypothetical protein
MAHRIDFGVRTRVEKLLYGASDHGLEELLSRLGRSAYRGSALLVSAHRLSPVRRS